jgi:hypothetical protein
MTTICYYIGAYGSTLRIDVQETTWMIALKSIILKMIENESFDEVDLCKTKNTVAIDINEVVITKSKQLTKHGRLELLFNLEKLTTIIGLIDGLLKVESGHQYLVSENNELTIELAYKESLI